MKHQIAMSAGAYPHVADWISQQQGSPKKHWEKFQTIRFGRGSKLLVAWLYLGISDVNVAVHCAATPGAIWCVPEVLQHVFGYPFLQLGCNRITAPISESNRKACSTAEHLGFKREGCMREADRAGGNVLMYGMLRRECRWLNLENRDALAA